MKAYLFDPNGEYPAAAALCHDYRPDWDYEIDESVSEPDLKALHEILHEIEECVLPALDINGVMIFVMKSDDLESPVGLYVNGTASFPCIGIDLSHIRRCNGSEGEFRVQLCMTLVHELGHAFVATNGCEEKDQEDLSDEEVIVEDFAENYVDFGIVLTDSLAGFVKRLQQDEGRTPRL